jgi:hypothetical protein
VHKFSTPHATTDGNHASHSDNLLWQICSFGEDTKCQLETCMDHDHDEEIPGTLITENNQVVQTLCIGVAHVRIL